MRDFPKKRMASGALITNAEGQILLVKPTYRPEWLIPGGIIEAHESPATTCQREVQEELGLKLPIGRILCIEYQSQSPRGESIQCIFDGGIISEHHLAQLRLPPDELSEAGCFAPTAAYELVNLAMAIRLQQALLARQTNITIYLEDGKRH